MVCYYVHNSMLLLIFLCKNNPVYALALTSYIHFNVVLPLQLTVPCFEFFTNLNLLDLITQITMVRSTSHLITQITLVRSTSHKMPHAVLSSLICILHLTTRNLPQHFVFKHAWPVFFQY